MRLFGTNGWVNGRGHLAVMEVAAGMESLDQTMVARLWHRAQAPRYIFALLLLSIQCCVSCDNILCCKLQ